MSIHLRVPRLSICPSCYRILEHRVEFNQTCYISSPHGKGLQHYLSVHPSICSPCYLLLNYLAEFNQTCCITSPHGKGVLEQHYFTVCSSIHFPSIYPSHYLLSNHWVEFNQTCYMYITYPHSKGLTLIVKAWETNIIFP